MKNYRVTVQSLEKDQSGRITGGRIDLKTEQIGHVALLANGRQYLATVGDHTATGADPVVAARLAFLRHVKGRSDCGFAR